MNWDDLRVFLAVHRLATFAAAGRSLGVNATTVGRRISSLEDHLGARLFTRTPDGLVPTATAESILSAAEQMERQAKAVARQIGGRDARLEGKVRLAVTGDFAAAFLVDHLGVFRRKHPSIEIELLTGSRMHDLSRGAADLAIRFTRPNSGVPSGPQGPTDLLAQRVLSIGTGVFGSKTYLAQKGVPTDLENLEGYDLVVPEPSLSFLPGYDWCDRVRARNHIALTVDGLRAVAAATAAGFGLCALPVFMIVRFPEMLRIGTPALVGAREVWVMMPADLRRVARVRALRDFLLEVFSAAEPMLAGRVSPHVASA